MPVGEQRERAWIAFVTLGVFTDVNGRTFRAPSILARSPTLITF